MTKSRKQHILTVRRAEILDTLRYQQQMGRRIVSVATHWIVDGPDKPGGYIVVVDESDSAFAMKE